MKKKRKQVLKGMIFCMVALTVVCSPDVVAYAATDTNTVTAQFNVLEDLVASIISSIGMIVSLWGISEFGMALQGNDGMMQSQSFKRIGGGLIMILAPQILTILT